MLFCNRDRVLGLLALGAGFVLACGPTSDGGGGGGGGGGNSDANPYGYPDGSNPGEFADADPNLADSGCGLQEENIGLVNLGDPPDMLIVLDRSGSMTTPIDLFNPFGATRWTTMRDALNNIVMQTQANIRWGLSVFPTDNDCGVSAGTQVPIDINQYSAISGWLNGASPDGNTPANAGLDAALAYFNSIPVNPEGRYVLFATDGEPNCDDADPYPLTLGAVDALAAAGIKTYVIGFGDPLGLPVSVLNDAAQKGGVPRAGGPPYYYEATNAAELQNVLQQISGGVIVPSCSYALQSQPPDPDAVTVKINGTAVPRDSSHSNGWDYYPDASTITFFGMACDDVQSGSISSVEFFFGCPGPVVN